MKLDLNEQGLPRTQDIPNFLEVLHYWQAHVSIPLVVKEISKVVIKPAGKDLYSVFMRDCF